MAKKNQKGKAAGKGVSPLPAPKLQRGGNASGGRSGGKSQPSRSSGKNGGKKGWVEKVREEIRRPTLFPKPVEPEFPGKLDLSKARRSQKRGQAGEKGENEGKGRLSLKRGSPVNPEKSAALKTALASGRDRQFLPVSDFRFSSAYGVDRVTHRHSGVDLAVPVGTQVAAAKSGKVSFAGWGNGYGYRVVIDHDDGTQTTYNHLSDIGVKVGDDVRAGVAIALSGNTGNSTGPHLHFEVKEAGRYVDPELYFDFGNGETAAAGSYTSQMAAVTSSSGGNTASAKRGGSSSGSSAASGKNGGSRRTKAKKTEVPRLNYVTLPEKEHFNPKAPGTAPAVDIGRSSVNYFQNDRNPLLEMVPVYRMEKRRTKIR